MNTTIGPYTVRIEPEGYVDWNPTEDPDTSACIITAHRRYDSTNVDLGDYGMGRYHGDLYTYNDAGEEHKVGSWEDVITHLSKRFGAEVLTIRMYDHSGVVVSANPKPNEFWFHDRWDSGTYGVVFLTRDQIAEMYDARRVTKHMRAKARQYMADVIDTLSQYMSGDVWYYAIDDEEGNELDSLGCIFGYEVAEHEAEQAARNLIERNIVEPRTFVGEIREHEVLDFGRRGRKPVVDRQVYRLDDEHGFTLAEAWIVRDASTRPKWHALAIQASDTPGQRATATQTLLNRGTHEECDAAIRAYFVRVFLGEAPAYGGGTNTTRKEDAA